jgi:glycolate oxidase
MGGTITGEHGVGMEKDRQKPLLFSEADLGLMKRVHDVFNPDSLLNPGKIFPNSKGCGEIYVRPKAAVSAPTA